MIIQTWEKLFDIYLPTAMGTLMIIFMSLRFVQLRSSAKHYQQTVNTTLTIRVFLILLVILFTISMCFLTLYDDQYWLYDNRLGAAFAFETTVFTAQIGCLFYEFTKNVPIMWVHKAYWVILFVIDTGEVSLLVYDYTVNLNEAGITIIEVILELMRFLSLSMLVSYSLFIRKQDIYDYEKVPCFTVSVPEIPDSRLTLLTQQQNNQSNIELCVINYNYSFHLSPSYLLALQSIEHTLLRVIISKDFKVAYKDDQGDYELNLKLKVIIPSEKLQDYKLKKTQQDFYELEASLLKEIEENPTQYPFQYPFKIPEDSNKQSFIGTVKEFNIVSRVQLLQTYMNTITSKPEYYLTPLIEFLKVGQPYRQFIETERLKAEQQTIANQTLERDDSLQSASREMQESQNMKEGKNKIGFLKQLLTQPIPEHQSDLDEEEKKGEIEITKPRAHHNSQQEEYLHYFDVKFVKQNTIENHIEYQIDIRYLCEVPQVTWTINKRFRDFKQLDDQIKIALGVMLQYAFKISLKVNRLPPLPKKKLKIQMDEREKTLRREGLENYLKTLLNEKIYFVKNLFEFIEFDSSKINNFRLSSQESTSDIVDFRVVPLGPTEIIEPKYQYTVYRYKIDAPVREVDGELKYITFRIIQKRYTDFENLHQALKVHFQTDKDLPELPPKFNPFGIHTTVNAREAGFKTYLTALFKVPNILDCFQFRRFIEYQNLSSLQQQNLSQKIETVSLIQSIIIFFYYPYLFYSPNSNYLLNIKQQYQIQIPSDYNERLTSELIGSLREKDELNSQKLDDLRQQFFKRISPTDKTRYNEYYD